MKDNQHEQLFTELTPEEGAVVEGGATFRLHGAYAITAREDLSPGDGDDLFVNFNGKRATRTFYDVDAGEFVSINLSKSFSGSATIQLMDKDGWLNPDDNIGKLTVSSRPTNGVRLARVGASLLDPVNSAYVIAYSVY